MDGIDYYSRYKTRCQVIVDGFRAIVNNRSPRDVQESAFRLLGQFNIRDLPELHKVAAETDIERDADFVWDVTLRCYEGELEDLRKDCQK